MRQGVRLDGGHIRRGLEKGGGRLRRAAPHAASRQPPVRNLLQPVSAAPAACGLAHRHCQGAGAGRDRPGARLRPGFCQATAVPEDVFRILLQLPPRGRGGDQGARGLRRRGQPHRRGRGLARRCAAGAPLPACAAAVHLPAALAEDGALVLGGHPNARGVREGVRLDPEHQLGRERDGSPDGGAAADDRGPAACGRRRPLGRGEQAAPSRGAHRHEVPVNHRALLLGRPAPVQVVRPLRLPPRLPASPDGRRLRQEGAVATCRPVRRSRK
mmetsp:Transcript_12960/g.42422  ORF Transcript_12960/g.42422 Transcript_12960/m.42422 type:complete len:271 (-) Transcript_12960:800-1612(-)